MIFLDNVSKCFQYKGFNILLFRDVNFSVKAPKKVLIKGASGSGKSTLLHMILGLSKPSTGSISWFQKNTPPSMADIGFISPLFPLFENLTISKNLSLAIRAKQLNKNTLWSFCESYIKKMRLEDRMHHKVFLLSQGEKQRLAFIRALLHKPKLLVLDEAFSHLDSENMEIMFSLLMEYCHQNSIFCFLAEHRIPKAYLTYFDSTYVIEKNTIFQEL